ncbi:hypothetical protein IQ07DRAFT_524679, partial [Pyrenochaeta sp. DS3sAY3a]
LLRQMSREHGASADNGSQMPPVRKRQKRSEAFMFIDASNGGVNAKPDRVVRSFVMKSARNKKTWSTRPKNPKPTRPLREKPRRRSSSRTNGSHEEVDESTPCGPVLECDTDTRSWDQWTMTSPKSSRSDSVFSAHSSNWAYDSPSSIYASPVLEPEGFEFVIDPVNLRHTALVQHINFDAGFNLSPHSLALRLTSKEESLLLQFVEAYTPCLLPIDPHRSSEVAARDWVVRCVQSPIAAPFIYAAITSIVRCAKVDTEIYKWRAISEVNKLLADPEKSTDDTTIATVLILLALEEADLADPRRTGNEKSCSIVVNEAHMNGLKTMIMQRGGLAALSGNRCLQVFILMHSIAQSITTLKKPYAILSNIDGQIEDYTSVSFKPSKSSVHTLRHFHDLGVDNSLFGIISTIALFISDLDIWYETGTSPIDSLDLQKHASLLMYRLFNWYDQYTDNQHGDCEHTVGPSICLATMIFMVIVTESNASFGSRLFKVVTELQASLRHVPISRWTNAPDLLLWTLTMGTLGAKSLPRASSSQSAESASYLFTEEFRQALFNIGFTEELSADIMLQRMRHCLWIPSILDERVKRLWVNIGLCRREVTELDDMSSEGERESIVDDEYALGQSTRMRFFAAEQKSVV